MAIGTIVYYAIVLIAAAVAYNGYVQAKKAAQAAAARSRGLVYQTRASDLPRRIPYGRRRLGGIEAWVTASGSNNDYINYIFIWGEGPIQEIEYLMFDDQKVHIDVDGNAVGTYAGFVKAIHRLGGADNDTAIVGCPGWGVNDKMLGVAHSWVQLRYDENKWPNGIPSISAVLKGQNTIWDPRDSTYKYTTNVALCFNHYLTSERVGPDVDYDTEVDEDSLIDCANVCDETVTTIAGSEPRYTFDGVIDLQDDTEQIIEQFRTAMAGCAVYLGGRWRFFPGVYYTPTFTIDARILVGPVKLQSKVPKSDHVNTVKGTYVSECTNFQPTDFPAVTSATDITADGQELIQDIDLSDTNSASMAQRIAKIQRERARRPRQVAVTCNIEALRALPGVNVFFNFPRLNFINQPMQVLEYGLSIQDNKVTINLTLREIDEDVFAWDVSEEQVATCRDGDVVYTIGSPPGHPGSPDGTGLHYDNLYDVGVLFPADATFSITCKTQGGTATLVGYSAFTSPASPPGKYLNKTFTGGILATLGTDCTCSESYEQADFTGVNSYDPVTGTLTQGATFTHKFNGSGCSGGTTITGVPESFSDSGFGNADQQICITSTTATQMVAHCGHLGCGTVSDCNNTHSGPPALFTNRTGTARVTLSVQDTEENAISRLEATYADWATITGGGVGSTCATSWEIRTSGFSFAFTTARVFITGSGYSDSWSYSMHFDLMERTAGSSDPFVKVADINVSLPTTGGAIDTYFDIPKEHGKERYVSGGTIS